MATIQELCTQAEALYQAGRRAEAEALFGHLLPQLSEHVQTAYMQGVVKQESEDREGAATWLQRAEEDMAATRRMATLHTLIRLEKELERYRKPQLHRLTGKNLILSVAGGYSAERLAPFVRSLRQSGFTGDAVTFIADLPTQSIRFLQDHGLILRSFENQVYLNMTVNQSRYIEYYEYLRNLELQYGEDFPYDYILLTDMGDVIFQGDPFAFNERPPILYFLEDAAQSFATCVWNRKWLETAFDHQQSETWLHRRISCSGTTFGTHAGLMQYLLYMQIFYLKMRQDIGRLMVMDQGIHNYILHQDLIPGAVTRENGAIVQTMGLTPRDHYLLQADGVVLNRDGSLPHLLHQYNRHPDIAQAIRQRFTLG